VQTGTFAPIVYTIIPFFANLLLLLTQRYGEVMRLWLFVVSSIPRYSCASNVPKLGTFDGFQAR